MKRILLVVFAATFLFVANVFSANIASVLVINKVDIHWWNSPGNLNTNIRTMHGSFYPTSSFNEESGKSLTVMYDKYIISFDFAPGYHELPGWLKNADWYISEYYKWKSLLRNIDFYEKHGLNKTCKSRYNQLVEKSAEFGSVYCLHMIDRVKGRVKVFDINSKKLIADYETKPTTAGVYDSPFMLLLKISKHKLALDIAVQLDKLPTELAGLKESLETSCPAPSTSCVLEVAEFNGSGEAGFVLTGNLKNINKKNCSTMEFKVLGGKYAGYSFEFQILSSRESTAYINAFRMDLPVTEINSTVLTIKNSETGEIKSQQTITGEIYLCKNLDKLGGWYKDNYKNTNLIEAGFSRMNSDFVRF